MVFLSPEVASPFNFQLTLMCGYNIMELWSTVKKHKSDFFFVLKRTWTIYSKYKYLKDRSKKGHVEYTCRAFQKIQMHGYLFLLFSTILIKLHDGFFLSKKYIPRVIGQCSKISKGLDE